MKLCNSVTNMNPLKVCFFFSDVEIPSPADGKCMGYYLHKPNSPCSYCYEHAFRCEGAAEFIAKRRLLKKSTIAANQKLTAVKESLAKAAKLYLMAPQERLANLKDVPREKTTKDVNF